VTVRSDFYDKIPQIKSVATVHNAAHVCVPRISLGTVRHVRAQRNGQARG